MRKLIIGILLLLTANVFSQSLYYVANAGNDANPGTIGLPWKTIQKVNATTFPVNSYVHFKRGDTFYGSLIRNTNNIAKYLDYGTGALPIISGATRLTTWIKTGPNKYYANLNADSTLNIVTLDGVPQGRARYPNTDAANRGYLTYLGVADASTNTGFSRTKIRGTIAGNWANYRGVVRDNDWRHVRVIFTADNGDTLTFRQNATFNIGGTAGLEPTKNNFTYFFEDDTSFLDRNGEYKYQNNLSRLYMYFADDNPSAHTIYASSVDTLMNLNGSDNLIVENIRFEYANQFAMNGVANNAITIRNCESVYGGGISFAFYRLSNSLIENNYIADIMGDGIYVNSPTYPYPNVTIQDNSVFRIGLIPGMSCIGLGAEATGISAGIRIGLKMYRNFVSQTGVDCFKFQGGNLEVAYNWGEYGCSVGQDHAIFYSYWDRSDTAAYRNRLFHHNFGSNAIGAPALPGQTVRASAFYFDGSSGYFTAEYNVGWNCPRKVFNLNIDTNVIIRNNIGLMSDTSTHSQAMGIGIQENYAIPITGVQVKQNVMYGYKSTQSIFYYTGGSVTAAAIPGQTAGLGTMDSNYYSLTSAPSFKMEYHTPAFGVINNTLGQWITSTGHDTHSTILADVTSPNVRLVTNWTAASASIPLGGTYKDARGVFYSGSITLPAWGGELLFLTSASPLSVTLNKTNVTCFNANNGSITSVVTGGVGSYSYLWSPSGQTTANRTSLSPGTYSLTVTDVNGNNASANTTITQPSAALVASATYGIISSVGGTTSVVVTATGGTTPYSGTGTITGVGIGSHTYTVTDANGCTSNVTIIIGYTDNGPLTSTVSKTNVSCFGGSNGTTSVSVSGGVTPYTYSWTGGGTTSSISGKTAGSYTVTVTDGDGHTTGGTAVITQPTALAATSTATGTITAIGGTTSVVVSASGGTPPYTGTGTFTGQGVGLHTYTVTDANSCTTNTSITLAYTSSGILTATMNGTNVNCFGNSTGSATVTASGGVSPYTYVWSPGGATTSTISSKSAGTYSVVVTDGVGSTVGNSFTITQPTALVASSSSGIVTTLGGTTTVTVTASGGTPAYTGTGTFTGVTAGSHTYNVSDANGCTTSTTIVVPYIPAATLAVDLSKVDVLCFAGTTGSITSAVTGGTPPYTYSWNTGQTTSGRTSIGAGTYILTVTDNVAATAKDTAVILQPPLLQADASYGTISTIGGTTSVVVTATGGTPGYTGTGTFTGVGVGTHIYTVTDANGCIAKDTIVIGYTSTGTLTTILSATEVACFGGSTGSVTSSNSGGVLPYTYSWSNAATTQNITGIAANTYTLTLTDGVGTSTSKSIQVLQPTQLVASATYGVITTVGGTTTVVVTGTGGTPSYSGTGTFTGVTVGSHTYNITDANGCPASVTINIPFTPPTLVVNLTATDVLCFGGNGSVTSSVNGGVAPYSYLWSSGQTSTNISGTSGTYILTVTDNVGVVAADTVTVEQPTQLVVTYTTDTVTVSGGTANVVISASGGTPSYSGTGSFSATAGLHTYTVTDANNCSTSVVVNVPSNVPPVVVPPSVPPPTKAKTYRVKLRNY